jgi:hypothetical protein
METPSMALPLATELEHTLLPDLQNKIDPERVINMSCPGASTSKPQDTPKFLSFHNGNIKAKLCQKLFENNLRELHHKIYQVGLIHFNKIFHQQSQNV